MKIFDLAQALHQYGVADLTDRGLATLLVHLLEDAERRQMLEPHEVERLRTGLGEPQTTNPW